MKYVFCVILCIAITGLYAQNLDSLYIKNIDDKLSVKFLLDNESESFKYNNDDIRYDIEPNVIIKTALGVHYRFISFQVGYKPEALSNPDEGIKGKTKMFNFQFSFYYKKWIQTFSYNNIKGFFGTIKNESGDGEIFAQFPSLRNLSYRGITRYNVNKNYSFKALTSQNEIQKKSSGSFIPSADYGYTIIKNGSSSENIDSWNINLNAGYFYTLVVRKRFYLTGGVSPGIGVEFNKLTIFNENIKSVVNDTDLVFKLDTYLGVGYNSETYFGGIYLNSVTISRQNSEVIDFETNRGTIQVFFGYRFKAPKSLSKSVDWIEQKSH